MRVYPDAIYIQFSVWVVQTWCIFGCRSLLERFDRTHRLSFVYHRKLVLHLGLWVSMLNYWRSVLRQSNWNSIFSILFSFMLISHTLDMDFAICIWRMGTLHYQYLLKSLICWYFKIIKEYLNVLSILYKTFTET